MKEVKRYKLPVAKQMSYVYEMYSVVTLGVFVEIA